MFKPELSNEEVKPTTSVESEDLDMRNVEQTRADVLCEIDEAVVVADTCIIVALVRNQTADENHVPDKAEIQTNFDSYTSPLARDKGG